MHYFILGGMGWGWLIFKWTVTPNVDVDSLTLFSEVEKFMKTGKFDPAFPVLTVINYKNHENFSLKFPSGFRETSQIWYIQVRIGSFF